MDIYFRPEYAQLCALIDGGSPEEFVYQTDQGMIVSRFIKREIPITVDNMIYYDIITPYGYGGPLMVEYEKGVKDVLVQGYEIAFAEYCRQQRIVSEFVRFHPLYNNAIDFESIYNPMRIRKTVGTDLTGEDPVAQEFSKSCRKSIRRALNAGVTYRITKHPDSIDEFIAIYYDTMRRDKASQYYYFDKRYFDTMLELFRDDMILTEAIYNGQVIASNICFVTDGNIHVHLSGTCSEYLTLSPAYVLKYADVIWGKENRCHRIHYGGGTSNSQEDPLYLFKKKFGQHTEFDFYTGRRIWDYEVYNILVQAAGLSDSGFFPAYRTR